MIYGYLFPLHWENSRGAMDEFVRRCEEKELELGRNLTKAEVVTLTQKKIGEKKMRTFDTGATRDDDASKPDYEGYLSPLVIIRFGKYMTKHRKQSDGRTRDSDNWQKGIPLAQYLKSLWRHMVDLWTMHRCILVPENDQKEKDDIEDALCAIIFNASGYLHEHLKATNAADYDRKTMDENKCGPPPAADQSGHMGEGI